MGLCVLVFDSSGELVDRPEETECGVPCSSGTKFVVGCSPSGEGRCWRFDRCSHGSFVRFVASVCFTVGKFATTQYEFPFPGAASDDPCFSEAGAMCRQRPKWDTWENESTPSSHVVLFRCRVRSQTQLILAATSGAEWCWSRPWTLVLGNSNEDNLGLVPCGFLNCWIV